MEEDVEEVEEDDPDSGDEVAVDVSDESLSVDAPIPVVLLGGGGGDGGDGGGGGGEPLGPGGGGGLGFEEGAPVGWAEGAGVLVEPQPIGSMGAVPRKLRMTVPSLFL